MIQILIASIFFGFIHPGSKLLIDSGLSLEVFVLLYIALRVLFGFPLMVAKKAWSFPSRELLGLYLLLGAVGAVVQFCEFVGIEEGVPVPVIALLVYSHPFWTLLIELVSGRERLTATNIAKIVFAMGGVYCVSGHYFEFGQAGAILIAPLVAGLGIAIWVVLTNIAKKKGANSWSLAFYYDLVSLLFVASYVGASVGPSVFQEALNVIAFTPQFFGMLTYSFVIGLGANVLFYNGSLRVSAFAAGLLLLLEPVVSLVFSYYLFDDDLTPRLLLGCLLVLLSNFPERQASKSDA